jgi:hypothetical protein
VRQVALSPCTWTGEIINLVVTLSPKTVAIALKNGKINVSLWILVLLRYPVNRLVDGRATVALYF